MDTKVSSSFAIEGKKSSKLPGNFFLGWNWISFFLSPYIRLSICSPLLVCLIHKVFLSFFFALTMKCLICTVVDMYTGCSNSSLDVTSTLWVYGHVLLKLTCARTLSWLLIGARILCARRGETSKTRWEKNRVDVTYLQVAHNQEENLFSPCKQLPWGKCRGFLIHFHKKHTHIYLNELYTSCMHLLLFVLMRCSVLLRN